MALFHFSGPIYSGKHNFALQITKPRPGTGNNRKIQLQAKDVFNQGNTNDTFNKGDTKYGDAIIKGYTKTRYVSMKEACKEEMHSTKETLNMEIH